MAGPEGRPLPRSVFEGCPKFGLRDSPVCICPETSRPRSKTQTSATAPKPRARVSFLSGAGMASVGLFSVRDEVVVQLLLQAHDVVVGENSRVGPHEVLARLERCARAQAFYV